MTFFDKYSYKQKNYALLLLGVLLLAVAYKRAFKTTFETLNAKTDIELKIEQAKYATTNVKQVQKSLQQLNKLIGKENVTVEKVQQGFLNFFARKSQGISVFQIDEVLNYKHPDFTILTHRIVLKGNFIQTLKFIYELEKDFDLAKLVNVSFEYKKMNSDQPEDLYTVLLLQNYEK